MQPAEKEGPNPSEDPYWDYLDTERFMRSPSIPKLTAGEYSAMERSLVATKGYKLHPAIARDMYGAFAAAGLVNYALGVAHEAGKQSAPFEGAIATFMKAFSIYPHPLIKRRMADVLAASGRSAEARKVLEEAGQEEVQRKVKDTDGLLVGGIESGDFTRQLFQ